MHPSNFESVSEALAFETAAGAARPGERYFLAGPWKGRNDLVYRPGLQALVDSARAGLKVSLNLSTHGPWVQYPSRWARQEEASGEAASFVEDAARAAGWLRVISQNPILRQWAESADGGLGVCSPRNRFPFWALLSRYSSPWAAYRAARAGAKKASRILYGFGWSPNPSRLLAEATVAICHRGGSTAGEWAAFRLLHGRLDGRMLEAGDWGQWEGQHHPPWAAVAGASRIFALGPLAQTLACELWRRGTPAAAAAATAAAAEPDPEVNGLRVCTTTRLGVMMGYHAHVSPGERPAVGQVVWTASGRTYHVECVCYSPGGLVRQAVEAWRRQDRARAEEAARASRSEAARQEAERELATLLAVVTPLVTIQVSREAGNCLPGTMEFARSRGWADRRFVPATWLLKDEEPRARAAAELAVTQARDGLIRNTWSAWEW